MYFSWFIKPRPLTPFLTSPYFLSTCSIHGFCLANIYVIESLPFNIMKKWKIRCFFFKKGLALLSKNQCLQSIFLSMLFLEDS